VVPLALVLGAALAGCTGDDDPDPAPPSPTRAVSKVNLTFGVWGTKKETDAYRSVVDTYNAWHAAEKVKVKVQAYGTHDDLMTAIDSGDVPDVFLVSRGDLADLRERNLNQPIGNLLDDRDVDFGDGYSRPALEAFSGDRELQCMPYGISPMVIYYNTKLVDFEAMAEKGLDVPNVDNEDLAKKPTWTLEQFQTAADYASRPRRNIGGFFISPTVRGLAPFIYSGGGQVFDNDEEPTSLAFSSDDTKSALEEVLPTLRDPKLTLSADMLSQKTPLEWFREGKLGMIAGTRDLVPELRPTGVLDWDVMPMPVVDDAATIGDLTGICISSETADVAESADFLVDFISTESVSAVAAAGYLAPANTEVALSDAFLQVGRTPVHSGVFNNSVKYMRIPPLLTNGADLEAAVAAPLKQLMEVEVVDLDVLTEQIDEASRSVLAPPEDPDAPDPGGTESPSADEPDADDD
jgi:multiple sugar transport system substrate-binding protein